MNREIEIEIDEIIRTYNLLKTVNNFMSQSLDYDSTNQFAIKNYPEIRAIYYKVVWNWLPEDIQEKLMEE